ncbi:MAG: carboxypeptidase regulatory-like domain-containing protein [Acidimicrobiales bacterium]|nr:carboxypeptidase regulatory-like domain-containing protein [Acidimicrobiales bacterium]
MTTPRHRRPNQALATLLAGALVATTLIVTVTGAPPASAAPPPLTQTLGLVPLQDTDLSNPSDVAVGPDGLIYVADFNRDDVAVFDSDGTFQRRWTVTDPGALAVSPATGHVYTLRSSTCLLSEFDATGTPVRTFGSCGSADGSLSAPEDLAVAPGGDLYVADTGNDRVQQFTATGSFVRRFGTQGTADGQFNNPVALAVGSDGTVFVADSSRDDVQAFDPSGTFLRKWGSRGDGAGQFQRVTGVAVAPDGSVLIVDTNRSDVQRYTTGGVLTDDWDTPRTWSNAAADLTGIAVRPDGSVFVSDANGYRIQRFDASGALTTMWGMTTVPERVHTPTSVALAPDGRIVVSDARSDEIKVFAPDGTVVVTIPNDDPGARRHIEGVAVDADGDILAVDTGYNLVRRYDADGTPAGSWPSSGVQVDSRLTPVGVAVGPDGDVFVSDSWAKRVEQFDPDGAFVRSWRTNLGDTQDCCWTPGGLDLDADGNVYVADRTNDHVRVFSPTGALLRSWPSADVESVAVDRTHGLVYAAGNPGSDCTDGRVTRTSLTGDATFVIPTTSCAFDVATRGDDVYVAEAHPLEGFVPVSRIDRFTYPAGPVVDLTLTVDETVGHAGTPVHFHVTVSNNGGVPLTGVTTSSTKLADCARSLDDVAVRATVRFDCIYTPVVADAGTFTASLTVDTAETDPVTSTAVSLPVNGVPLPFPGRQWRPSPTGLSDGDPIGGTTEATAPGLAVGPDGDVHVVGSRTYPAATQVQRFSADGRYEQAWGTPGTSVGQLHSPEQIAVGPSGEVYVTECESDRIQRFTADGTPDGAWTEERSWFSRDVCSPADVTVAPDGTAYVADAANDRIDVISGGSLTPGWGTGGNGDGQFNNPIGVAAAPDGTVYVLDAGNRRVQRFTAAGGFLGKFASAGTGLGQLSAPVAIDVDGEGRVYVTEWVGGYLTPRRVQVFTPTGQVLANLPIGSPRLAVHTDAGGSTHVYSYPSVPTAYGTLTGSIREYVLAEGPVVVPTLSSDVAQLDVGDTVTYTLRLDNPGPVALTGVVVDAGGLTGCSGPVEELAAFGSRTVTCSSTATTAHVGRLHLLATVETNETPPTASNPLAVQVLRPTIAQFTGGPEAFDDPVGLTANWQGDLWVADCGNDRVVHLSTADGSVLGSVGQPRTPTHVPGHLNCPADVVLDDGGNVLVLDRGNQLVQEFEPTGAFQRWWLTRTSSAGTPNAIDVDGAGNVYVTDSESTHSYTTQESYFDGWGWTCCRDVFHFVPPGGNNLVRRFGPDGTFLSEWGGYDSGRFLLNGLWITGGGALHLVNDGGVQVNTLDGVAQGTLPGLAGVKDVAVDRFGHIWAVGDNRLRELTPAGNVLSDYPIPGATNVAVDRDNVYVTAGDRVLKLGVGTPVTAITGRVAEDNTDEPVPGAYVVALRESDLSLVRGARADEDGYYRMDVPAGRYLLEFYDPSGAHRFEWYDNNPAPASLDEVPRVTVTEGAESRVDTRLARDTGFLSGPLFSGGSPAGPGIEVIALRRGTPAGSTTTAGSEYLIEGLRPGTYTAVFVDPTGAHTPIFYSGSPTPTGATTFTIAANDGFNAGADLPAATPAPHVGPVSGTVTEEGTGRPVEGVMVVALRASDLGFVRSTRTAADGSYTLSLPSGEHLLEIADPSGAHRFEWYDDEAEPASFAELTTVTAGTTSADAALRRTTGAIGGTVTTGGGSPVEGAWVIVYSDAATRSVATGSDGSYTIEGLPPGSYTVAFVDPTATLRFEYHEDRPGPVGTTPVTVTADGETTVDAALDPVA